MPKTLVSRLMVPRKTKIVMLVGVVVGVGVVISAAFSVYANQSPGGCNSNRLNLSIVKNKTQVHQGDILTYTVTVSNPNSGSDIACDITNASITLRLPAADGTPTGTLVTLDTGRNIPSNTGVTVVGSTQYTVNVNPGVTDIVVEAHAVGVLHDAPTNHSAEIIKTLGTSIVAAPADTDETPPSSTISGSPARSSIIFDESRK